MTSSQILSLPGMADVTGGSFERSAKVVDALGAYYASRGYAPIDTPIVEDEELFVRKSGGELSGMLYTFDDPGGNRVSLRPEITPSVIRHYIEHKAELVAPARLRYCGPVFRYHSLDGGDLRQFTQVGTELIGLCRKRCRRRDTLDCVRRGRGAWPERVDGTHRRHGHAEPGVGRVMGCPTPPRDSYSRTWTS